MLRDKDYQRMKIAQNSTGRTNCIGTALFVLGLSDRDTYIGLGERYWDSGYIDQLVKGMNRINSPKERALLVLREKGL
jgi:hypothetical protein